MKIHALRRRLGAGRYGATSSRARPLVSRGVWRNGEDGRRRDRTRRVIAKQAQIDEIGCARQKFEWREIAFIQCAGVRPHPANAVFFQKPNDLRPMPSGVAKFNRVAKIPWQLFKEFAQCRFAFLGRERRRQLNQQNVQLRREHFQSAQEGMQFTRAIIQPPNMCDLAREFAGETKFVAGHFQPAPQRVLCRDAVKSRVDLNCGKVTSIKLEPLCRRKILRVKAPAPFFIAPRARADADFLLVGEIQVTMFNNSRYVARGKGSVAAVRQQQRPVT